jgi:hypothetical protein
MTAPRDFQLAVTLIVGYLKAAAANIPHRDQWGDQGPGDAFVKPLALGGEFTHSILNKWWAADRKIKQMAEAGTISANEAAALLVSFDHGRLMSCGKQTPASATALFTAMYKLANPDD